MKKSALMLTLSVIVGLLTVCQWEINDSVKIRDGEKLGSGRTAVNGNVFVGSDCEVRGTLRAVNGTVRIGSGSVVGSLQAVNGGIGMEENVKVRGSVRAVNGPVMSEEGVEVEGAITAANGSVELYRTHAGRDIVTYNGDIILQNGCLVEGSLIIKRSKGSDGWKETLQIILDGSVVRGDVNIMDKRVKVKLILRGESRIEGKIINAEVIKAPE